jgi:hypothetical protein
MRSMLNVYDHVYESRKSEVFSGVVVKDAQDNANVYMLKIDDIEALRKVVNDRWEHKDYARYTVEDDRIKAIHKDQEEIFKNSNGQIEKSFLQQFPSAGISLYKADASLSKFDKLTLINGTVTPNPCN